MVAKGSPRVAVYYSPKEAIEADGWSEGVSGQGLGGCA